MPSSTESSTPSPSPSASLIWTVTAAVLLEPAAGRSAVQNVRQRLLADESDGIVKPNQAGHEAGLIEEQCGIQPTIGPRDDSATMGEYERQDFAEGGTREDIGQKFEQDIRFLWHRVLRTWYWPETKSSAASKFIARHLETNGGDITFGSPSVALGEPVVPTNRARKRTSH